MWDTLEIAKAKFFGEYNKHPPPKQLEYIEDKGNRVALISLTSAHGVLSENNAGHFSLYEYDGVHLDKEIKQLFDIFDS